MAECEVCLEAYDSVRVPKFLVCYHTFCNECLKHIHSGGSITCPSCRKQTAIDDVQTLQTNFYLASQDSTLSAKLDKLEGAKAPEELWYWCGSCEKIAGKTCEKDAHERYGLSTALGKEMTENHLKTYQLTCRLQWEASLAKRKDVDKTLAAIADSLQSLLHEVGIVGKNNRQRINKIESNLKKLSEPAAETETAEKSAPKNLATLCQKYNDLVAVSKADGKEITSLSCAFSSLQNAVVSLDVKSDSKGQIDVPLFTGKKIGFPNEGSNSRDSHALTVLSYLILSNTPEGKVLQQEKEIVELFEKQKAAEAAKGGPKPAPQVNPAKSNPNKQEAAGARPKVPPPQQVPTQQQSKKQSKPHVEGKDKPKGAKPNGPQPKTKPTPMNKQNFNPQAHAPNVQQLSLAGLLPNLQQTQVPLETVLQLMKVTNQPSLNLAGKKSFLEVSVNGNPYGRLVIELRPDVAPTMCQKFAQACLGKNGPSYRGTMIFKCEPKTYIIGGRTAGTEGHFIADSSPLKRTRGAVFLRLKKDIQQTQCPVVSNEFIIQLNDDRKESTWSSTVFGFITEGLAICDAISHLDPKKDHIAITKTGIA